jgi:hypothetical protein
MIHRPSMPAETRHFPPVLPYYRLRESVPGGPTWRLSSKYVKSSTFTSA